MKRLLTVLLLSIVLLLQYVAWANRVPIKDWWELRSYKPTQEIEQLANSTDFSSKGRDMFYVSDPQLLDSDQFNNACPVSESTIVLGCYDGINIYIFDVQDPRLAGIEEVTAAHEMLHAAYERLSADEKSELETTLLQVEASISDERVKSVIASYSELDYEGKLNELHSIFATEVPILPLALESYYAQYFNNRQTVVALSDSYESVFVEVDTKLDNLDTELEKDRFKIKSLESRLNELKQSLDAREANLDGLAISGDIETYNSQVRAYRVELNEYNGLVSQLKQQIEAYNQKVRERNQLAITQGELVNSIDSVHVGGPE